MKTINGNVYVFHNEMPYCRDGFTHKSTLLRNGNVISEARAHYINRTWEVYQFQTSMRSAVQQEIDLQLRELIDHYKRENGKSRVSQAKKDELAASTPLMSELKELYDSL